MIDVTTDTTVIVKGLIPPRRKKRDAIYDYESVKLALSFVSQNSELYSDAYLLEKAMEIGMRTKASGFDVVFMSCTEVTGSILITDDKGMYEKARDYGLDAEFLRDLNEEL